MNEVDAFVAKYNAEITCGNIIATHEGERKIIGQLLPDGSLLKLIMEDINPPSEEPVKRGRKAKVEDVSDVEVQDVPAAE